MGLRLIKSEKIDNPNDYVTTEELKQLSGITKGQFNSLVKYQQISKGLVGHHNRRSNLYPLSDLVYCRIYYELRQFFTNQFVKRVFKCSQIYDTELLNKNYILIENNYEFIEFLDSIEDNVISDRLTRQYLYSSNEKINDKLQGYIEVDRTYINLKDIRIDLYNRSIDLGIDDKLQRIA